MLACLLLLVATALGLVAARRLEAPLGPFTRLGVGIALGQLALLWLPVLLQGLGLGLQAAATVALGIIAGALLLADPRAEALRGLTRELRQAAGDPTHRPLLLLGAALLSLLAWLLHTHYLLPRADGLHSAGVTWGDLPVHLALVARFLHDGGVPPEHPLFLGGALTYPFVPDHCAAVGVVLGLPLRWAFIVPALLTLASLLLVLHGLSRLWLDARGALPSMLMILLFLLAGGLGFLLVVQELAASDDPAQVLGGLNATYIAPHALKSGHVGNLFIAARTAIWGMALGGAALLLLGHAVQREGASRRTLLAAGLLAGALPLVHAHSFLVVCGAALWYAAFHARDRRWLAFAAPLLLAAAPQLLHLLGAGGRGYTRFAPGFLRPAPSAGEWMLDLALGMGLWLLAVPLAFALARRRARRLAGPLLLLLPIANVVTFTPAEYDNVKLLAWFDVAAAALLAELLAGWLRSRRAGRVTLAVLVGLGCTASGALAVAHELVNDALLISHADLRIARAVAEHTAPDAIVATAATHHDPVAMFSGRRVLIAAPEMLETHGIDVRQRAAELVAVYAGAPAAPAIIEQHGIDAVLVGPRERRILPRVNAAFLEARAARVIRLDDHRLYLLRAP